MIQLRTRELFGYCLASVAVGFMLCSCWSQPNLPSVYAGQIEQRREQSANALAATMAADDFEPGPLVISNSDAEQELLRLGSGIRDLRAAADEAHRFFVKANALLTDIESGKRGVVLESRATLRVEARAK